MLSPHWRQSRILVRSGDQKVNRKSQLIWFRRLPASQFPGLFMELESPMILTIRASRSILRQHLAAAKEAFPHWKINQPKNPKRIPDKPRYDEVLKLNIEFAKAIRDEAAEAMILGPVLSGYDASPSI